jgi:hypothetical protein
MAMATMGFWEISPGRTIVKSAFFEKKFRDLLRNPGLAHGETISLPVRIPLKNYDIPPVGAALEPSFGGFGFAHFLSEPIGTLGERCGGLHRSLDRHR